jgi:hypothetical protein
MSWIVRVTDSDNEPKYGISVTVQHGFFSGGIGTEYTNMDGEAEFEIMEKVLKIYVDGETVFDGEWDPEDGDTRNYEI